LQTVITFRQYVICIGFGLAPRMLAGWVVYKPRPWLQSDLALASR